MTPLLWCIIVLALGLALIFLEMFVPSAGVLGVLAAIAVITSVVLAFVNCGPAIGTVFTIVGVILVPVAIGIALRIYPHTPFGRRILAIPPTAEEVQTNYHRSPDGQPLKGQLGKAKTPLLPGGSVKIAGATYNAVSEGGAIDQGNIVLVLRVEGKHLVVRKVDGELPEKQPPAIDPNDLSQPIDAFGLDPFDDPPLEDSVG